MLTADWNDLTQADKADPFTIFEPGDGIPIVPAKRLLMALQRGFKVWPCLVLDEHRVLLSLTAAEITDLVPDPQKCEKVSERKKSKRVDRAAELRGHVNRRFVGARKKNVASYKENIVAIAEGRRMGTWGGAILWSPAHLAVVRVDGQIVVLLPPDPMVAIDGETGIAAWHEVLSNHPEHGDERISVVIMHGISSVEARQTFADAASLGVKVHASEALMRDSRDEVTAMAMALAAADGPLQGKVSFRDRSLTKTSPFLLTLLQLRTGIMCFLLGVGAVRFGAKPLSDEQRGKVGNRLEEAASDIEEWISTMAAYFGDDFTDRTGHMYLRPPVFVALMAFGGRSWRKEERLNVNAVFKELDNIDWKTGSHWAGAAGKVGVKGFSVGSPRELGHTTYASLTDKKNPFYLRIRGIGG